MFFVFCIASRVLHRAIYSQTCCKVIVLLFCEWLQLLIFFFDRFSGAPPSNIGNNTKLVDWMPQNDLLGEFTWALLDSSTLFYCSHWVSPVLQILPPMPIMWMSQKGGMCGIQWLWVVVLFGFNRKRLYVRRIKSRTICKEKQTCLPMTGQNHTLWLSGTCL